jgi:hypothetical protein
MVPSSALNIATGGECLPSDVFSLSETIHFGSLKFDADHFSDLSLSPMGNGSDAAVMGSTQGKPPSPLRAMTGDSTEEFHMTSNGEGRIDHPSPIRNSIGAWTTPPQSYRGWGALRPLKSWRPFHRNKRHHGQTPTSP